MKTGTGSAAAKLVLVSYADRAHDDGTGAWPSVESVAQYAECRQDTVRAYLKYLVAEGLMRPSPASPDPGGAPCFDLAMNEGTRAEWRAEHSQAEARGE
jgi:hypothetical protein